MYDAKLSWPTGCDWPLRVEVRNDETNELLDTIAPAGSMVIEMQLQDQNNCVKINLTTADGSITVPSVGIFQWNVPLSTMRALCPGNTYRFGVRITTDGGTTPLMTGSLAYIDGEFEWQ